jgi:hypothetical protein
MTTNDYTHAKKEKSTFKEALEKEKGMKRMEAELTKDF